MTAYAKEVIESSIVWVVPQIKGVGVGYF